MAEIQENSYLFGFRVTKRKWRRNLKSEGNQVGPRREGWGISNPLLAPLHLAEGAQALGCCFPPTLKAKVISPSLMVSNIIYTDSPKFTFQKISSLHARPIHSTATPCPPLGIWWAPNAVPLPESSSSQIKAPPLFQFGAKPWVILTPGFLSLATFNPSANTIRNGNTSH